MVQKNKDEIFGVPEAVIDPVVKEMLRNASINDRSGIDPVTVLERDMNVTTGVIKNDLNITATQTAVIEKAQNESSNLDHNKKFPPEVLDAAEKLNKKPEEIGGQEIEKYREIKAREEEAAKKAAAAIAGSMIGLGFAIAAKDSYSQGKETYNQDFDKSRGWDISKSDKA